MQFDRNNASCFIVVKFGNPMTLYVTMLGNCIETYQVTYTCNYLPMSLKLVAVSAADETIV